MFKLVVECEENLSEKEREQLFVALLNYADFFAWIYILSAALNCYRGHLGHLRNEQKARKEIEEMLKETSSNLQAVQRCVLLLGEKRM